MDTPPCGCSTWRLGRADGRKRIRHASAGADLETLVIRDGGEEEIIAPIEAARRELREVQP
jgi:hypothetical protein